MGGMGWRKEVGVEEGRGREEAEGMRCLPLHVVGAVDGHGAMSRKEACTGGGDACAGVCVGVV